MPPEVPYRRVVGDTGMVPMKAELSCVIGPLRVIIYR